MSIDLVRLGTMVWLVTPTALEFLIWIGFLGCGHPISMKVWSIGTISLAGMNNLESSSLVAEDMTYFILCAMARMGPF